MEELRNYIEQLTTTFREQPAEVRAAVGQLGEDDLHEALEPGGWTPHQVVAHLVASDENALLPRLRRILEEESPQLPNWDEDRWMEEEYDPATPLDGMLDRWGSKRSARAATLLSDDLSIWNRTGVHPIQRERTLLWWLEYAVAHVRAHLDQLGERGPLE